MRLGLVIIGRVQGVWFRASMQREARRLGLRGWVRNRPDGAVEAEADGPAEAVEHLVAWAHQGPPGARVDAVQTEVRSAVERHEHDFEVRR